MAAYRREVGGWFAKAALPHPAEGDRLGALLAAVLAGGVRPAWS